MAVKTNHSPRGCSFRWGGAVIAQTKHTWKKSHNNWNSQWWFWINAQRTIESEIPASFSKPGMERRYIGSHRRFVWGDVYVSFTLSNRLHFHLLLFRSASQRQTKQTKSNMYTSPGRGSQSSESWSHIPLFTTAGNPYWYNSLFESSYNGRRLSGTALGIALRKWRSGKKLEIIRW